MSNSKNCMISVPRDTHFKLSGKKLYCRETFNEVILRLIEFYDNNDGHGHYKPVYPNTDERFKDYLGTINSDGVIMKEPTDVNVKESPDFENNVDSQDNVDKRSNHSPDITNTDNNDSTCSDIHKDNSDKDTDAPFKSRFKFNLR